MLIEALIHLDFDPGFILGSEIKSLGTNAHYGKSDFFVIEADEYDYMFHGLKSDISIITNIEWDHPDCFPTPEEYEQAFVDFLNKSKKNSVALICSEDARARQLLTNKTLENRRLLSYGFEEGDDYHAILLDPSHSSNEFVLATQQGGIPQLSGPFSPNLPGTHNALNATAILSTLHLLGINPQLALGAVENFSGTERRWDIVLQNDDLTLINDYGHHPTQLRLTLEAARQNYPNSRIIAVWEPHTFSRTQRLESDYIQALKHADLTFILPIYAAREKDEGYTPKSIGEALEKGNSVFLPDLDQAAMQIFEQSGQNDIIIVFCWQRPSSDCKIKRTV